FRVLTLPKLAEYFAQRWRKPLLQEAFRLQVAHGKNSEIVRPNRYEGELLGRRVRTDLGHVEFELYIVPRSLARHRVSVLGAGGVEILADICQDPEFDHHPWCSDQVHGEVRFGLLRQTTGRRGLQHDRKVFPVFAAAVQAVEAELIRRIEQLNREQESSVDERLKRAISQAFRKALAELHALSTTGLKVSIADPSGPEEQGRLFDNEAAAALDEGSRPTEPGAGEAGGADGGGRTGGSPGEDHGEAGPRLEGPEEGPGRDVVDDEKGRVRQRPAVGLNYRPVAFEDTSRRSRYNEALRTIEINRIHPDYLRARAEDRRLFLDYMVALVAKELTLLNYEGIDPGELLERYVELLAKVQLHLPKRV
ncbi:MAG: hypothetical protein K6U08_06540, partial [Firmicutes bacterium]|nr:hypothetical protein [Bacillota bacterium]